MNGVSVDGLGDGGRRPVPEPGQGGPAVLPHKSQEFRTVRFSPAHIMSSFTKIPGEIVHLFPTPAFAKLQLQLYDQSGGTLMDQSPLLASSFILSKLSTNILVPGTTSLGMEHKCIQMHVINHHLLPDVETDTDHLTEYLSLGFPGPGLLLLPGSFQLLLPIPQPSNLTISLVITSLSPLLPPPPPHCSFPSGHTHPWQ